MDKSLDPSQSVGWITYPFPNFNGATVEVREWVSNYIQQFNEYVITYPY